MWVEDVKHENWTQTRVKLLPLEDYEFKLNFQGLALCLRDEYADQGLMF